MRYNEGRGYVEVFAADHIKRKAPQTFANVKFQGFYFKLCVNHT